MSRDVSDEVESLLTGDPVMAHLATSVDDRPHVAPVWFRYDDGTVEVVTEGRKLENVRRNPRVALSIQQDSDGRAEWMVVLQGTATVVEDDAENREATRKINRRYGASDDAYDENVLVRIDVGTATARRY